jgi:hypothetical protein
VHVTVLWFVFSETKQALWRTISWGTQWGQLDGLLTGRFLAERCLVGSDVGLRVSFLLDQLFLFFFGELSLECDLRVDNGRQDSYLVDSASSHMLVSKIKPCMSKYKQSIL